MTIRLLGREFEVKKTVLVLAVISAAVIAGGVGVMIAASDRDIIVEQKTSGAADEVVNGVEKENAGTTAGSVAESPERDSSGKASSVPADEAMSEESIKVYVVGCVKNPGVITLKKGQLIDDAVRSAGGLTADADPDSINMVFELKENVMLYIQSKKEIEKSSMQQSAGSASNNPSAAGEAGRSVKVVKSSGSALVNGKSAGANIPGNEGESTGNGKININTASEAELDTLPGVGEATARDIISYRVKNGPFKDIKDIMKIPRIKDSRFNAIKDLISVE
jgi:competence protein ComEA